MFKEYVSQDIDATFFNAEEFCETAKVNGACVRIVQDNDRLSYKIKRDYDGLIIGDILFYISAEEYIKIPMLQSPPRTGEALSFNGKPATITEVSANAGVFEIIIQFAGAR